MLDEELQDLVRQTQKLQAEGQTLEVKCAHNGCPDRLYDTLSSFSNQDEGGVILFGLDETKGFKAVGVYDAQDLQQRVANQCEQMQPAVRPLFTLAEIDNAVITSVEIPSIDAADRPCFYKGKGRVKGSYRRIGERDQPMTEYEIYSYEAFRKKYQDDVRVFPDADISTLEPSLLADYLQKLKANKPNLAMLSDERICSLMSIMKDEQATLAAEMLVGFYPQAFAPQLCIVATAVPGETLGDTDRSGARFTDNKRIEGTISQMLNEALAFVRTNTKSATIIDSATGTRRDVAEYPMVAVREVILNALVHRDYSIHTEGKPIRLTIFQDRLEVESPGGLYGRLRADQLGHVQSDTRNPVLATAMEVMGLTENRYSGIPTIRRQMEEAELPEPTFLDTQNSFIVTLRNRREAPKSSGVSKPEAASIIAAKNAKSGLIEFCARPRTRAEITAALGLTSQSYAMSQYVTPLVKSGKLAMTDPDRPRSKNQKYVATSLSE
ncbi:ATP-binding protein [uncultured Adlercreutzia sp.]|uniref:ATP-binding protein n=1 Tax=uncultured Adlercreutzia sp. TaxID=875803 RepID=UPI0026F3C3D3|nr:ATP-binding protein [uncultured Adlercreutzia sp.]